MQTRSGLSTNRHLTGSLARRVRSTKQHMTLLSCLETEKQVRFLINALFVILTRLIVLACAAVRDMDRTALGGSEARVLFDCPANSAPAEVIREKSRPEAVRRCCLLQYIVILLPGLLTSPTVPDQHRRPRTGSLKMRPWHERRPGTGYATKLQSESVSWRSRKKMPRALSGRRFYSKSAISNAA